MTAHLPRVARAPGAADAPESEKCVHWRRRRDGYGEEILRHKSVEKVVMVDIDEVVCDIALTHLKQWSAGVKEDPRFSLFCEDAKAHLENDTETMYDVIIMDIADPVGRPWHRLVHSRILQVCDAKTKPRWYSSHPVWPGSHFNVKSECFSTIHRTLRSVFDRVRILVDIPSFGSNWGFNIATGCERLKAASGDGEDVVASTANAASASNGEEATAALLASDIKRDVAYPLTSMTIEERDAALRNRFEGGISPLKYYDGITHLGMFGLPIGCGHT